MTVTLRAAPVLAAAVKVTPVDAVPVVALSESQVTFSDSVHEQPTPVAVTFSVPVPPPLPILAFGVESDSEQGSPAAWMIVATAEGPPLRLVSRKVTVAVRWDVVLLAAKLTVTV